MKLYTEEEIVSFLKREFSDEINAETFMENLSPIELPTDEEIKKMRKAYIEHVNTIVHKDLERDGYLDIAFLKGAKCVIDKIEGGEQ
jgi:hypothetical protein